MINADYIDRMANDKKLQLEAKNFFNRTCEYRYSYNFTWLGRPIIQYPQDIMAMQEILWQVQPDLVIETGIAHGGSLVFTASMLELIALSGGNPKAEVLGIDIDIRAHNRKAVEEHPMKKRITMIEGSSVEPSIVERVRNHAKGKRVMVCLDSNHTHEHVLSELEAYASLTSLNSYCVVFDTVVDDMPASAFPDRPWGPGNNPKTAVRTFLKTHAEFEIDRELEKKLLLTVAPGGYLRRTK